MTLKIGIDVGGTFTDFIVARDGEPPRIYKTLSTPADPSIAVVEGLAADRRGACSRRSRWPTSRARSTPSCTARR